MSLRCNHDAMDVAKLLKIPETAFEAFLENLGTANFLRRYTQSHKNVITDSLAATLNQTYGISYHTETARNLLTATAAGDPHADLLDRMVMTVLHGRLEEAGIWDRNLRRQPKYCEPGRSRNGSDHRRSSGVLGSIFRTAL